MKILLVVATLLVGCAPSHEGTTTQGTTWVQLKAWSGDGIMRTDTFSVGSERRIDWDSSPEEVAGVLQIYVYDATPEGGAFVGAAANTQKAGPGTSFQHRPGPYYLEIHAAYLRWKVEIQELR